MLFIIAYKSINSPFQDVTLSQQLSMWWTLYSCIFWKKSTLSLYITTIEKNILILAFLKKTKDLKHIKSQLFWKCLIGSQQLVIMDIFNIYTIFSLYDFQQNNKSQCCTFIWLCVDHIYKVLNIRISKY